jgi:uncharacterized LabA/DUF88 family protein
VDTLIVLDLVRLAQRHAYYTAVVIAGDRDLAEAVRVAQDEGRQVVVAHPHGTGISTELQRMADHVISIDSSRLQTIVRPRGTPRPTR